jgi:glycosyltransferase involved in cell wall biosynthesis
VKYSAVSDRVARDVRAVAGTQPLTVLPNGIDVAFWRIEPTRRADDAVQLVSVMRLNTKKRPLALVSMMQRLGSVLRDGGVHLRIVGDGPLRARLGQTIARAGLGEHIELLGKLDRGQIRALFAESDAFVLPTVRESFGLAALEARCAGLPVVAMRESGVSEFITHEREGLLAGDDDDFATQVARLVSDPDLRDTIVLRNRATSPVHDWPRVVDAHLALYREAIALRASV